MSADEKKVKMDRKITFRVDDKTYKALESIAKNEGFTISVMVRNLVVRFLRNISKNRYL